MSAGRGGQAIVYNDWMANILLGVTGSVAAIRTPELRRGLQQAGHIVRVVATKPSLYFFDAADWPPGDLLTDEDEWPRRQAGERWQREDPVLHIELRRWADALVIAPLDANTLGKLAGGLADNCLTCVVRAWDMSRPVILAPAMNTHMWEHPATRRHLAQVAADHQIVVGANAGSDAIIAAVNQPGGKLSIVSPQAKQLACGDVGMGAMADVDAILAILGEQICSP